MKKRHRHDENTDETVSEIVQGSQVQRVKHVAILLK